jgi:hypothetical protein
MDRLSLFFELKIGVQSPVKLFSLFLKLPVPLLPAFSFYHYEFLGYKKPSEVKRVSFASLG